MVDVVFLPIPRQEIIDPTHGMAVGHALKDVLDVDERLHVELCGGDEGTAGSPACAAAVGACEQEILAAERDRSDRAFDRAVVELDAAGIEEALEGWPAREGIADRL